MPDGNGHQNYKPPRNAFARAVARQPIGRRRHPELFYSPSHLSNFHCQHIAKSKAGRSLAKIILRARRRYCCCCWTQRVSTTLITARKTLRRRVVVAPQPTAP